MNANYFNNKLVERLNRQTFRILEYVVVNEIIRLHRLPLTLNILTVKMFRAHFVAHFQRQTQHPAGITCVGLREIN